MAFSYLVAAVLIAGTLVLLLFIASFFRIRPAQEAEQPVREPQARVESEERYAEGCVESRVDRKYWAPYKLKCFIQDQVIKNLNWQRNDLDKDQFAAVVLSRSNEDFNELRLKTGSNQLVNSDEPSYPDSSNLVNYIVARPDSESGNHTEEVLLDRFNELLRSFGQPPPSLILIFSWLMPCERCTDAIINRLGHLCTDYQVLVVFRSNCKYKSRGPEINEENRKKLSQAKFKVYHVTHTEDLPRQRP